LSRVLDTSDEEAREPDFWEDDMTFLRAFASLLFAACAMAAGPASAQTYPSRPITLIVPYPPGGATDAISRIIQDGMSQSLGQQLVVENIGGAGGMIAATKAARAAPDGYTILIHQVALAAGMTLYKNLSFDAEKDFVPIGLINTAASAWSARPDLPPNNIAEMVRWMKEPGRTPRLRIPASARSVI
jgi:tripartite-type tricarboxylate transporter receptor subunit TctC